MGVGSWAPSQGSEHCTPSRACFVLVEQKEREANRAFGKGWKHVDKRSINLIEPDAGK